MVKYLLKIKLEGTRGFKHETSSRTIDIRQDADGNTYFIYTRLCVSDKRINFRKNVDALVIEKYINQLSQLTIPAFPNHDMGCDGGFTEVEMGAYDGKSHYRWWSSPPKGWEELDQVTEEIIEYCDTDDFDAECE